MCPVVVRNNAKKGTSFTKCNCLRNEKRSGGRPPLSSLSDNTADSSKARTNMSLGLGSGLDLNLGFSGEDEEDEGNNEASLLARALADPSTSKNCENQSDLPKIRNVN